MFDVRGAPVAAPDKPAAVRELPEESKIAFPARLSSHYADDVARQAVVMNPHGLKVRSAVVEKRLLALLAAVGFIDHDFNSHLLGCGDYALNQLARRWFKQRRVADALHRVKALVLQDHIGVEVSHAA